MLMLLSPSKTMDETSALPPLKTTQPVCREEAFALIQVLRNYSGVKLSQLMDISDKLAAINVARYAEYSDVPKPKYARPALFLFKGDVYEPMAVASYGKKELEYAQAHLRILSGLYGVIRPLDLIQPYRLEMGTRLATPRGKDLYAFWGSRISEELNAAAGKKGVIVNLASEEYYRSVKIDALTVPVVTIAFKEKQKDKLKVVGLFAKRARGMIADFAIQNQIKSPEKLKDFDGGGYRYQARLSSPEQWVFTR